MVPAPTLTSTPSGSALHKNLPLCFAALSTPISAFAALVQLTLVFRQVA